MKVKITENKESSLAKTCILSVCIFSLLKRRLAVR